MKKTHILTFLILIFLSGPVSAETLYIPYSGFVYNATGEIWCVRQSVFQLSTGEGFAEYDRGIDKCVVTLVLDSHKEPAEITSVDLAIIGVAKLSIVSIGLFIVQRTLSPLLRVCVFSSITFVYRYI